VIFGFEQANKYTILDETGATVALMAEDQGGLGREIGRQLLRTRRPFTATVFTPDGSQVIFRVRRPFYLINVSEHDLSIYLSNLSNLEQPWDGCSTS
jgi:Scramblase